MTTIYHLGNSDGNREAPAAERKKEKNVARKRSARARLKKANDKQFEQHRAELMAAETAKVNKDCQQLLDMGWSIVITEEGGARMHYAMTPLESDCLWEERSLSAIGRTYYSK